jgi:hypothetical protein
MKPSQSELDQFAESLTVAQADEDARITARMGDVLKAPERVQILNEGARLTNGNRDIEYGPPSINLAAAGELKAVFRKHLRRAISPGEAEAIDQVLTKIGRVATGTEPKRDTYVDGATYFAIAGEIALSSFAKIKAEKAE